MGHDLTWCCNRTTHVCRRSSCSDKHSRLLHINMYSFSHTNTCTQQQGQSKLIHLFPLLFASITGALLHLMIVTILGTKSVKTYLRCQGTKIALKFCIHIWIDPNDLASVWYPGECPRWTNVYLLRIYSKRLCEVFLYKADILQQAPRIVQQFIVNS